MRRLRRPGTCSRAGSRWNKRELSDVGLHQADGGSEERGGAADGCDDDQRGF